MLKPPLEVEAREGELIMEDQPKTEYVRYSAYEEREVDGRFVAFYALEDVEANTDE